ncbi:MAG: hypothetical protein OXD29_06925 [Roseovarius sp.]|nr:hypothetical protein [Roseovarius sp.]MCY4314513.1 hypothetical protein [Roseovarius sp.]
MSFEEFAEAVQKPSGRNASQPMPSLERVAVLGGGADARLVAALCLSHGARVALFSAYGAEIRAMKSSSGIVLRGEGPIGTYQIDSQSAPSVKTTAELDVAVSDADLIVLTGPVHKQRTYSMVLAGHLRDGQVLLIVPGRTMGALETARNLRVGGNAADVTIVEAQGLPYWIAEEGAVLTLSEARSVAAASLPGNRPRTMGALSRYLPNLEPKTDVLECSFSDGSALVEIPALMLGGVANPDGMPEMAIGGVQLEENKTFAALIGSGHRRIIETLAEERANVARAFGVRDLPDADKMIRIHAGALSGTGRREIPERESAMGMLRDGVVGSLAPLVSAAGLANVPVPLTRAMITLAGSVLGADVAAAGRKLSTVGIEAGDINGARAAIDDIATGAR